MTVYAQPKTMPDGTVFDAEYYANTYPDVKAAFGNDEKALYNHYIKYGKAEGRLGVAPQNDAIPVATQAQVVSVETISEYIPTRGTIVYGTMTTLTDGTKIAKTDKKYIKHLADTYQFDEKYIIPRTDYSTGLIDKVKNGIDDRDPYNSCGYTDLNYNCVADGAPCSFYMMELPDLPNTNSALSPEEVQKLIDSATPKYYKEEDIGLDKCCEHGIVWHAWSFYCKKCVDAINEISRQFEVR